MIYVITVTLFLAWLLLIGLMMRQVMSEPKCPECGAERIESVDMRTATIEVEGEKTPAAWMYRRCMGCRARLKWDVGQNKWVELAPGEWEEVVRNAQDVSS